MRPLRQFPEAAARAVRFVLCDIDDTLTSHGRMPARAYAALERLDEAGFTVVPVTGRPAGWCDLIARFWPIGGVVGENGAFYFRHDAAERRMLRRFWFDPRTRRDHRARLGDLAERIVSAVPGAAVAADQLYREGDLAIDYCEDVAPLDQAAVDRIVGMFRDAGAVAKVSSIHINGWFGDNDKSTMSRVFLEEVFAHDLVARPESVLFVGDSPNDCPMFAAAGHSVGVANVRDFADRLDPPPQWVAESRGGAGFAEVADHLIRAARGG